MLDEDVFNLRDYQNTTGGQVSGSIDVSMSKSEVLRVIKLCWFSPFFIPSWRDPKIAAARDFQTHTLTPTPVW